MGFSCPFPGAGWNRISYWAKYFSDTGVQCSILSTFFPVKIERLLAKRTSIVDFGKTRVYNIVPQIPLEYPFLIIINNLFSFVFSLPFILLKKPDTIIISIAPANQLLGISWISKLLKKKLVVDYRDEVEENWLSENKKPKYFYKVMRKVCLKIYQDSFLVTPTTSAVAKKLSAKGVHNVYVVADGVDTKIFKPLDKKLLREALHLPKNIFILIFVGYIQGSYRVDVIVKALKLLKEKNKENEQRYTLLVVGGGDVNPLLRLAKKLDVTNMVKHLGIIASPTELVRIINVADIGMIPYNDNPTLKRMYPTKIFEYTACGLPVIGTTFKDSILADYVQKYGLGQTVLPLDYVALAAVIEDLYNKSENLSEFKLNALAFSRMFEKAKIAEKLLSLLFR